MASYTLPTVLCLMLAAQAAHGARTLRQAAVAQQGGSVLGGTGSATLPIVLNDLPGYKASTDSGFGQNGPGVFGGFAQSKVVPNPPGGVNPVRSAGAITNTNVQTNVPGAVGAINTQAAINSNSINAGAVSLAANNNAGATANAALGASFKSAQGGAIGSVYQQGTSANLNGANSESKAFILNRGDPAELENEAINTGTSANAGGTTDLSKPNVGVTVASNVGYTFQGPTGTALSSSVSNAQTFGNGPNVEVGGGTGTSGTGQAFALTGGIGVAANVGGKIYQSSTQFNNVNAKPGATSTAGGFVAVNGQQTAGGSVSTGP